MLDVPTHAEPGERDRLLITATSTENREVTDEVRLTTTILPPPPQAVGRKLYPDIPAELSSSISLFEGEQDSTLSFEAGGELTATKDVYLSIRLLDFSEIGSFNLNFDCGSWGFEAGDVGISSGLSSISGSGLEINWEVLNKKLETSFLKIWEGGGGKLSLSTDWLEVDLFAMGRGIEGEEKEKLVHLSAAVSGNPFDISSELAGGNVNAETGLAYRTINYFYFENFRLSGRFYKGESRFPGGLSDVQGLSSSFQILMDTVSLGASYSHSQDNVDADATQPTVKKDRVRAVLNTSFSDLPNFGLSYRVKQAKSTGPPPETNEFTTSYSLDFRYSNPSVYTSLSYDRDISIDKIANTAFGYTSWRGYARFSLGEARLTFRLEKAETKDLKSGEVEEEFSSNEMEVWIPISQGAVSLGLSAIDGAGEVAVGLNYRGLWKVGVSLGATVELWEEEMSTNLNLGTEFMVPFPFIKTKGQVKGRVFVDANQNRAFDPGEEGIPNLLLTIDGAQALSGPNGEYIFPPLRPGEYELNMKGLPTDFASLTSLPLKVKIKAGVVAKIDLPVTEMAAIKGTVFNDKNQDGKFTAGEPGMGGVRLMLSGPVDQVSFSASDGTFSFANLPPGKYEIALDEGTLPERFELTSVGKVSVEVKPQETVAVKFGAFKRPLKIVFAPTADFTFKPEEPAVGDRVTFDASASFDPDGQIVKYEWDFNGDGVTDKQGKIVKYVFEERGEYPVTLTVTDNDGETDQTIRTVGISG